MSQRILVFENDAAFAGEVKSNFERMGLLVEVASDGPSGLELAAAHRPDLILLTIELPGMNGFLVCKKIKKTVELENVPLVILSSEVDQETFEQHKKLRTRADEYIRKPIAFADLLQRVQSFVPQHNGNGSVDAAEAAALDIEEAFSVGDDDVIVLDDSAEGDAEPAVAQSQAAAQSHDTSPGTNLAGLTATGTSQVTPAVVATQHAAEPAPAPEVREAPVREPTPQRSVTQNLRAPSQSVDTSSAHVAELERIKRELAAAEEKVQAAERRASVAEQRAGNAEKSLDAAKRTGGASSRELLDLREQLNRKDRELLDLRDQVTARDKQLIEASDRSLGVERELQDSRDKTSELQRELEKKTEVAAALTTDKENIRKRLDDTKARAERAEAKAKEFGAELDNAKNVRQLELEELRAQHTRAEAAAREEASRADAALRAEHAAELEKLRQQHGVEAQAREQRHAADVKERDQRHAAEVQERDQRYATAVQERDQRHAAEIQERERRHAAELEAREKRHADVLAAQSGAHDEELSELREEHALALKHTVERVEQEKHTALDAQHAELTSSAQQQLASAENARLAALASLRDELSRRHAGELSDLNDKSQKESARLNKLLSEAHARYTLLEERHEESESGRQSAESRLSAVIEERAQLQARNVELDSELGRLKTRLSRDEEILERVRKAMAIGLGLLESQKQGPEA